MKVVVLGGGFCQLNMIKRLKEEGHYIILADYLDECPGKTVADEHRKISTFDIPAVSDMVIESGAEAIITMGTDQPVLSAAVAAENAGLPFYVDSRTAVAVTNKLVMKEKFVDSGIPTVSHRFIKREFSDEDIAGIEFPAVIKPVDSQGQRGVFKVQSPDEIRLHIDETLSYSKETRVLLEEYYPNDEITVSGCVHDGKAKILSVVDRVTMEWNNRIGICIAHNYPSRHFRDFEDDIIRITQAIVDAFEIQKGPIYFQFLIGEKGVLVNEIAMRIGGAYEDIVLPVYSGIDQLGMVMDFCLGRESEMYNFRNYDIRKNTKNLSNQLFFIKPGTITYMTHIKDILDMEGVHTAFYLVGRKDRIRDIENATARAGYFVVEGMDYDDTMSKVDAVFDKLSILDENGINLVMRYNDYKDKYKFV